MTSGVPKKYHGGTLGVPQWYQSTAGWVFPWETTHLLLGFPKNGGEWGKMFFPASSGFSRPDQGFPGQVIDGLEIRVFPARTGFPGRALYCLLIAVSTEGFFPATWFSRPVF